MIRKTHRASKLPQLMRNEIRRRKLTQYRIAQDTGIKQPSLCKFLKGGSLRIETAAMLLDYLGFKIAEKGNR